MCALEIGGGGGESYFEEQGSYKVRKYFIQKQVIDWGNPVIFLRL
jgi:hypothetical protein